MPVRVRIVRLLALLPLFSLAIAGRFRADEPSGGTPDVSPTATPILTAARLRVPSPVWLREGDTLTGSVEASIEEDGTTRLARPEEIRGVVKLGEWNADRGIVNEITQPVEGGRFVLGGLPGGQRVLRFFLGEGIGAELARVNLLLGPREVSPEPSRFAAPLLALSGGEVQLTGPFAGAGDWPRLTADGLPARLVWETASAALFQLPAVAAGRTGVVLSRAGQADQRAETFVVSVVFSGPDPPAIGAQGDDAMLEARVVGLPPAPGQPAAPAWPARKRDRPVITIAYRNLTPESVTGIRTRHPGGWEAEGELFVPVRTEAINPGGIALIVARAHGWTAGPVRVDRRFILEDDLTRPIVPFVPVS